MRNHALLGSAVGLTLLFSLACATGKQEFDDDTGDFFADADADTDADSDTDTDADSDTDTDTDTDADVDTGIAQFYFVGGMTSRSGTFESGEFGYGLYGLGEDDWVCRATGDLEYEGRAPAGCPDCEFSFDAAPISGSSAIGDYCAQFGLESGSVDGAADYGWGFTNVYYYDYNGTPLPLEDAVMLYIDEWFVFAYNYGGSSVVTGNASSFEFARPVFSGGSPVYYYYYPY